MSLSNLSADEKASLLTSLATLILHDAGSEVTSESISTLIKATGNDVEGYYPIIFSKFASGGNVEKIISNPAGSGGGAGGADGPGGEGEGGVDEEKVEEKKEKKEEEEEIDLRGGIFGDDEMGDGDY